MINKDRIVPVTKTDLLTLFGAVLNIASVSFTIAAAKNVAGDVDITGSGSAGTFLCNQPARVIDLKSGVTGATVYFMAADDFKGIKVAGADATFNSSYLDNDDVVANGDLYKAVLSSGTVTLTAVSPQAE